MDILEHLRGFFAHELAGTAQIAALEDNQPLLQSGLLDSLGILKLVTFIESKFDVTLPGEDIIPENFETLDAIARLVSARRNLAA